MAEQTKASRVSYNKEDVEREATEERLADDIWVRCVIDEWVSTEQDPTKGEGPGIDLICRPKLTVLDPKNPQERTKWAIYHRMVMPLRHPDYIDTHVPPPYGKRNWFDFCRAALSDKHPDEPRYNKGDKKWYYKGKAVDRDDCADIKKTLVDPLLDEGVSAYNEDGKQFIGKVVYVLTKINGDFTNIKGIRDHLPEEGEFLGPAELAMKLTARGTAKSNGKSATTKTKARGKTSKAAKSKGGRRRRV